MESIQLQASRTAQVFPLQWSGAPPREVPGDRYQAPRPRRRRHVKNHQHNCALHGTRRASRAGTAEEDGLPTGRIVNSGASHHTTGDHEMLTELGLLQPFNITLADSNRAYSP